MLPLAAIFLKIMVSHITKTLWKTLIPDGKKILHLSEKKTEILLLGPTICHAGIAQNADPCPLHRCTKTPMKNLRVISDSASILETQVPY